MRRGQNNDLAISKVHTMVTLWVGDEWSSFTYTAESAVGLCVQRTVGLQSALLPKDKWMLT